METETAKSADGAPVSQPFKRWLYLGSGMLIGGFFLYLTMRNVDFNEALAIIYGMNKLWVLPLTVIYLCNLMLRTVRWQLMFPDDNRPSLRHTVDAFLIGKLGNNFMPGRLGELLRAGALGRVLPGVGISGSLATVVLEKVFDSLAIMSMLGLALFIAPLPPWIAKAGLAMMIIFPTLLVLLVIIDRTQKHIDFVDDDVSNNSPVAKLLSLVRKLLLKFSTGLSSLRHARHFAALCAFTTVIWALEVVVLYICFQAFAIPAPFTAALITLVFLCAGSMLPAAPGLIGTYQLFIVSALQLYAIPETNAFAMAVFLNLYVIVLTTSLGLIAVFSKGGIISLRQSLASARKAL